MDINVKATTELGLRQHYRDNVTLLSVHKIVVDYWIMSRFVETTHLDTETIKFFVFFKQYTPG